MFAKLIASSMDEVEQNKAHTSFVEIIKQLSPLDAQNIIYLKNNRNVGTGVIRVTDPTGDGGIDWIRNFFPFPNANFDNYSIYSASVDNLIRLGLVKIDRTKTFTDSSLYNLLESHIVYKDCLIFIEIHHNDRQVKLEKVHWNFTDFGKQFVQCCL